MENDSQANAIQKTPAKATLTVAIETHGCKLNTADSQGIAQGFLSAGHTVGQQFDAPDVYILNSCTVTHVADRKARQAISAARRRHPAAMIVATGCYAERDPGTLAAMAGVDLVVANSDKSEIVARVQDMAGLALAASGGRDAGATIGLALLGRTRASIKIQEGCDQVCAYCIVPSVRGRERSVPVQSLIDQVNRARESGCQEVVLTGTQLGTYGFDLPNTDLVKMLGALLDSTDVPRIRVSSLQPPEITDDLLDLWAGQGAGRLCPHFHVPLQSGSDSILKLMRRHYSSAQFLTAIQKIRSRVPGAAITSDVIAGFPGESHDEFTATVDIVERSGFADAHVFPYSSRPGTSAVHFADHIPDQIKAERAATLREVASVGYRAFRENLVGGTLPVLWEKSEPYEGLTTNYVRVRLTKSSMNGQVGAEARFNAIHEVRLVSFDGDQMLGTIIPASIGLGASFSPSAQNENEPPGGDSRFCSDPNDRLS